MSKYYTPSIEEFCIGFEYEISGPGDTIFRKDKISSPREFIDMLEYFQGYGAGAEEIRVKYLDQEDIEELGFKLEYTSHSSEFVSNEIFYDIFYGKCKIKIHKIDDEKILIEKVSTKNKSVIFDGKIKNKSELSKILKMVV